MKVNRPIFPTRETASTITCIDQVITTQRSIHSIVYAEKGDFKDHYGILLVTGVTTKILGSKRVYRVVKDMENPEIAFKVLFVGKHFLGETDFNTIDLENRQEMLAQILLDVTNRIFLLKTRKTFSSTIHSSWITRKTQNELKKPQKCF